MDLQNLRLTNLLACMSKAFKFVFTTANNTNLYAIIGVHIRNTCNPLFGIFHQL